MILLRPWWLLALLPAAALALWLWRRRAAGDWAAVIDPALLPAMRHLGHLRAGAADPSPLVACAAAALLSLALAGPAVPRPGADSWERLDPIVLLLDLSPSVASGPALADLQAAAAEVLKSSGGRPVAIMVYAADAYVASAPTSDAASLEGLIAVLSPRTMPVGGSRPDIALAEARDVFADGSGPADPGGADFVLVSDGGGADRALDEARRLAAEGASVSTLFLAPRAPGAPAPNPDSLAALAREGGGAAALARDPRAVLERIEAARVARLARSPEATLAFRDLGPFFLGLAALPALALFRRRL
ncbi:MAG: VWA domain-containing protein [Amaricoccus sp.]